LVGGYGPTSKPGQGIKWGIHMMRIPHFVTWTDTICQLPLKRTSKNILTIRNCYLYRFKTFLARILLKLFPGPEFGRAFFLAVRYFQPGGKKNAFSA
jgi:hypothetical protein